MNELAELTIKVHGRRTLPTIQSFKNGDQPSAQEVDISGEYTKTITRNFGISLEEDGSISTFPAKAIAVVSTT